MDISEDTGITHLIPYQWNAYEIRERVQHKDNTLVKVQTVCSVMHQVLISKDLSI